jgi:hypothetical protein
MLDMLGTPIWVMAVPPLVAFVTVLTYVLAPRRRRDPGLRSVLIVSVALTALEGMILALLFGFLVLFSTSGGMENF